MITLYILSVLVIVGTLLPISDDKHWFIRAQAYFRFWYFIANILLLAILIFTTTVNYTSIILSVSLIACSVICLNDIIPFSRWYKKEIRSCSNKSVFNRLNILAFNVYQENEDYDKLIQLVNSLNPDIVLLIETNNKWYDAMKPLINLYPYSIKAIQENTYGMMMLSKLEPLEKSIEHLSDKEIPSIDCLIELDGQKIRIKGLHPKPPIPGEALTSKQKDAEFKEAAKQISQLPKDELVLVIGDLNDVVWSKASKRFKKTSGLKDPRVGRGTYSTFPTYFPIRFPLDHIFCSSTFLLSELKVLDNIGSDHFPIFVEFCLPE